MKNSQPTTHNSQLNGFKNLIALLILLITLHATTLRAQDVSYSTTEFLGGGNPHLINTAADNDATASWTLIHNVSQTANKWSTTQNLPSNFRFHFYGENVTQYKVSLNGVVTFTVAATTIPGNNASIPTATLPNKSIACFWDEFLPTGADDKVYVSTKGTSPNRQLWIKWCSMKMGSTEDNYYACVLEEGTGNIYIVDMYTTSALTSTQTATVGIQKTATEGSNYANPYFLKATSLAYTDNNYYQFSPSFTSVSDSYYSGNFLRKNFNPLLINTANDTAKMGYTTLISASKTANQWSSSTALPFAFEFYGESVTDYKVSINGVITFTTSATSVPAENASLPSSSLPDKSIACFWDAFANTNTNDKVYTYTYGTSPNRQLWIKWYSLKYGTTASENNYFACVLEETSNRIYIIDLRNESGAVTLNATVGLQNNSSDAIQFGSGLRLKSESVLTHDNNYFQFTPSGESPLLSYTEPESAGSGNPGDLNTETDMYSPSSGGWTALTVGSISTNAWSSSQTLPFTFLFFGEAVTQYKVTSNGLLTFNTSTALLPSENDDLPSPLLPDNTIACFWDAFPGVALSANDIVYYKKVGTSPNQQLWIKWYSMRTGGPYSNDNYFACVLEETTNKIYFVDMYNTSASLTQAMTVGVQYNANNAVQYSDKYYHLLSTNYQNSNNYYYEFIPTEGDIQVVYDETDLFLLSTKGICRAFDDDCAETTLNEAFLNVKLSTGDIYNYGSNAFTETVKFTLTPYLTTGTGAESSEITLEIDQSNPLELYRLDIADDYDDLIGYKIKINSYTSSNDLVDDDLEMKAYYTDEFGVDVSDVTLTTTSIASPASDNPITLEWTTDCEDVPGYEIQVLRLYNTSETYNDSRFKVYATVDWDEALSILTTGNINSYTLSLTEGSGYYMWRIRPIGSYYDNGAGDSRNWGEWSSSYINDEVVDINGVSDLSSTEDNYIFYYSQFNSNKSWIYDRVFTEDGKVSENIVFADGLGLARQKQHKMQENDAILAGQTLYDYVGRAAVNTMMAPIETQNKFQYIQSLVEDESGDFYGAEDFDSDLRYDKDRYPVCAGDVVDVPIWENALPMYGPINEYYSDENPDLAIPNAENYPYSRTVFHKDGRQKKTSLYGAEHRMGLYDETYMLGGLQRTVRTYYSSVSDTELIKVFGNETPADTGVYKIVRVDPNEVPTVEYKTLDGRTIATCMINTGDHPLLDDISEVENIITQEIKGNVQKDPYTLIKEKVITFTEPTVQIDIDYLLDIDEFEANCISYCSTCDYVVELYVIREETREVKWSYTQTLGPDVCGGTNSYNPDDTSASESLADYYDVTCPQMVLTATDASTIMLSDPGNYRIGRKITVNSKYDGEARYRDYHADTINTLLDEEAAKFDPLFDFLDEESGDLMGMYDYLETLSAGSTSACDDETSESGNERFDFSSRFGSPTASRFGSSGIITKSGSSLGGGTSTSSDIWEVDYVENVGAADGEQEGTYTLASSCLEIEVPKIPCDFNPCVSLLIEPEEVAVTDRTDWQQDLFDKYGGYYDFEKMLTDEYSGTYGENLYEYFFDKYGEPKYPSNAEATASITISNERDSYQDAGSGIYKFSCSTDCDGTIPEYIIWVSDAYKPSFTFTITKDGTTLYTTTLSPDAVGATVGYGRFSYTADGGDGAATAYNYASYVSFEDFMNASASYLNTAISTYDISVDASNITIETSSTATSSGRLNFTIDYDDGSPTFTRGDEVKIVISSEFIFGVTNSATFAEDGGEFAFGNGAFNAMITHMVMEPLDGSNEDAYDYDCYDMYLIWEEIVNDYETLHSMFAPVQEPGLDLLEYFLEKVGKQYGGYADHDYGKGDENAFLEVGLEGINENNELSGSDRTEDFGYGYLEYAYKSFEFDYGDIVYEQKNICAGNLGIKLGSPIFDWTNPVGEDDNGDPIWDSETCGSDAWWDGSSIIEDEIDEDEECQAWSMLYECINSDLELYGGELTDLGYGSLSSCDNSPEAACIEEFATLIVGRTIDVITKSDIRFANNIRLSIDGISDEEATGASTNLRDYLEGEFDLEVQYDGTTITGLGTDTQLDLFYNLQNKNLNVSSTNPGTYTKLTGGTFKMSDLISKELNLAYGRSESVTSSEVTSKIEKIYNRYGWDKTNLSSSVPSVFSGTISPITRLSSSSRLSFTASSGRITLNNITSGSTSVLYLGLGDADIVIDDLYYEWGNEMAQVSSIMRTLNIPEDCDSRNLTYVSNHIRYALDDAKECRLDKSLAEYDAICTAPSSLNDTLKISYSIDYHQYTLFYYDMAGNLVKVVPPKGADIFLVDTDGDGVRDATPSRQDVKDHQYITKYKYNSLGQRTYEETPDGGVKQLFYNSIDQLRFAQNEKQAAESTYEYYKYDNIGNLIEAGLCSLDVADNVFADNIEDGDYPSSSCFDRIVSVYGDGSTDEIITYIDGVTEQTYVDNRIQYTYSDYDGTLGSGDEVYTDYSYDPHGNVQWMLTAIPDVAPKYIYYEYDLVTGKVTEVKYNEGKTDQFYHRYSYDADMRVTKVETSHDGVLWDTDAEYEYYAYGPMKRLSIGEDHIQGIDYVYTINGWLKANNHQSLNSEYDPGGDGSNSSTYAKDVFGMTLGYFDGDFKRGYRAIYSPFNSEFDDANSDYYNTGKNQLKWDYDNADRDGSDEVDNTQAFNYHPLFNGTITSVAYGTQAVGGSTLDPYNGVIKGMKYKYDELYRLTESNFDYFDGSQSQWARSEAVGKYGSGLTDYNTSYTYDLMGNIETLTRYDDIGLLDELTYHYEDADANGVDDNNRLAYISDAKSTTSYAYDLENQTNTSNYEYDEIGELISDVAEGISNVEWTRTGKIKSLTNSTSTRSGTSITTTRQAITFAYDAMDKRVSKEVTTTSSGGSFVSLPSTETTYYVYDANGQVMSVYTLDASGAAKISEQPIYAGTRIGMEKPDESITLSANTDESSTGQFTRSLGYKSYAITDYLGNIRGVVSDAKERSISGDDTTYTANLLSSNDYMPYGMLMPHTDNSSSDYRYGFQGMEKDDEIKDGGNSYDFGARLLDPRVGRWLSRDPLAGEFPSMSPYNAMGNDPINMVDPDGKRYLLAAGASEECKKEWARVQKDWSTSSNSELRNFYLKEEARKEIIWIKDAESTPNPDDDNMFQHNLFNSKGEPTTASDPEAGYMIMWNSRGSLENIERVPGTENDWQYTGGIESPRVILLHEMIHASHRLDDKETYFKDLRTPIPDYDNLEELKTIWKANEITNSSTPRTNHTGVASWTRTKEAQEYYNNKKMATLLAIELLQNMNPTNILMQQLEGYGVSSNDGSGADPDMDKDE